MTAGDRAREFSEIREAVVAGVPELAAMTDARTGNLSVRDGERVAVTPTGVPYADIDVQSVPVLTMEGEQIASDLDPSSETPMHLALYRALDFGAILHAHAPWSTTMAVLGAELPPVHYMLAAAGGTVPVVPYAPFGTEALAKSAVETLEAAGTSACFLANHGLIAAGSNVEDAIETAVAVESTSRLYLQAQAVGEPVSLTDEEMEDAIEQFETYGQQSDGA